MLEKRAIGNTDILVSLIGLGTVKFGRNQNVKYPHTFELPLDKDLANLLAHAQSLGINLLDTAPAYGLSEERLGKLLKDQRHEWIVCSKAGEEFENGSSYYNFSAKHIRKSIERSLKRLNTDYLDMVLIHSDGNDESLINQEKVLEILSAFKQAGWIRAFGMSTKTVAGGILALDHSDLAMVTFNPTAEEERTVIRHAEKNNKGILIKKALASGHIAHNNHQDTVQQAFDFILQEKGVSSIIVGTINPQHLEQNVGCIQ